MLKATRSDENARLRSLAIDALAKCHHINENSQAQTGVTVIYFWPP